MKYLAFCTLIFVGVMSAYGQCSSLRQQRNITFNTDKDCAPVTVTDFTITYFFNTPQNAADIVIRFDWNDPADSFDEYSLGDAEFTADGTNTEFTAEGTFTYPINADCVFEPVSTMIVDGEVCETSAQVQVVASWSPDNNFGGTIEIDPGEFDVCFNNPVVNAVFEDNSTFNCNINQEPDSPNRLMRVTQFVYGTNHNGANSIRNLSLVDGGGATVDLTDNAADLSNTITRGGVTAGYFGPVLEIPFPADGPELVSYPISAPADVANVVGNSFEVTLYNWNVCNPYNGDPVNPNYADAVMTTAYIQIVDPPVPDFQTRLDNATGNVQSVFCLGETVYFDNLTPGGFDYDWELYDDASGTDLLTTSGATNPTYVFNNAGNKLIRLHASNPDAQGNCSESIDKLINISPAAVAGIGLYDQGFVAPLSGTFCGNGTDAFVVGFRDETTNVEPDTEWRWEFYDTDGTLDESIPPGANAFGASVSDFTRSYTAQGVYRVDLIARNNVTLCESVATDSILVYDEPEAYFEAPPVCEGVRTSFQSIADSLASLAPRVDDDHIVLYEWDFSYDGVTFNPEFTPNNNDSFDLFLDGSDVSGGEPPVSLPGSYEVALRMTTAKGTCVGLYQATVTVNELPVPMLTSDYTSPICPDELVLFTNQSDLATADYQLIVTDGAAVEDTLTFNELDTAYQFANSGTGTVTYSVHLLGITQQGCQAQTSPLSIEVFPAFGSGFYDAEYSVISGNCSLWESTLIVDNATQALSADQYTWTISDANGVLPGYPVSTVSSDPDFHQLDYSLENTGNTNQLFTVLLEVEKAGLCVESSTLELIINPRPSGDFTIEIADSCTYKTIRLEAEQKGLSAYNWEYDPMPDQLFDDGEIQRLVYLRADPAALDIDVDIALVTENLASCQSDTIQSVITVERLEEPILVDFTVSEDTIILPDSVIFLTNQSSSGLSYLWDFGDGATSTLFDPSSHAYGTPGTYQVRLTVSNQFCEEEQQVNVVVEPADPIIDFVADRQTGCNPLTVSFTNMSTYAEPGTFFWEFGDGKTSTAENPTHTYGRSGEYTVRLYGANRVGSGAELIRENYIEVYPQPVAAFAVNPQNVFIPGQEVFLRNSSAEASVYSWDFGDGGTSSEENPTHAYTEVGDYDITLIAASNQGCADTLTLFTAVKAVEGGQVKTPNAFSPGGSGGGDTMNDTFIPRVEGVTRFRMLIYNKWGQLLFESRSIDQGWDGYFNGRLQPTDVYVYRLELTYSDGREVVKIGDVTLIR